MLNSNFTSRTYSGKDASSFTRLMKNNVLSVTSSGNFTRSKNVNHSISAAVQSRSQRFSGNGGINNTSVNNTPVVIPPVGPVAGTLIYADPGPNTTITGISGGTTLSVPFPSIPSTVTTIGMGAFSGLKGPGGASSLGTLNIPSSVTRIEEDAFYNSGFTGPLNLPSGLTHIGADAFNLCRGFTGSLTIPSGVTTIGDNAFALCDGFTGTLTLPSSLTSIGERTFYYCDKFTGSLTIPPSVTTIGYEAFAVCSGFTGTLTLSPSLTSIGGRAFFMSGGFTGTLTLPPSLTSIEPGAFYGCDGFTGTLNIPSGITTISSETFVNCDRLTSLILSPNVTTIGEGAFRGCIGLTGTLNIPPSVTTIGNTAFNVCIGLTSLSLSPNLTTIGNSAFATCNQLTGNLIIPSTVTTIGDTAFNNCTDPGLNIYYYFGTTIVGPSTNPLYSFKNCVNVFTEAFIYDDSPTNTRIRELRPGITVFPTIFPNVTAIGASAFYPSRATLTGTVRIPSSVIDIETAAFRECAGLTQLLYTSPYSLTNIGDQAFYLCTSLTAPLIIPPSVVTIGENAFLQCSALTGPLVIPGGVTFIDKYAFAVTAITSLVITNGVAIIGETAFAECASLTSVSFPNSLNEIGVASFGNCVALRGSITIPSSVTRIRGNAFNGCTSPLLFITRYAATTVNGGAFFGLVNPVTVI